MKPASPEETARELVRAGSARNADDARLPKGKRAWDAGVQTAMHLLTWVSETVLLVPDRDCSAPAGRVQMMVVGRERGHRSTSEQDRSEDRGLDRLLQCFSITRGRPPPGLRLYCRAGQ